MMLHHRFCICFLIIFVLTVPPSHAAKGKVGSFAQLDSDDIKLKTDKPIRNVYFTYKVDGNPKDSAILAFVQALEVELFRKGFRLSEDFDKADLNLRLEIKKFNKEVWIGLPTMFGSQRYIRCLAVQASYKTKLGQQSKEFIAHKGYWTYTGDAYFRDTTTYDLARAIINPLHDYPKEKELIKAALNGDMRAVTAYIEQNIDINADNDEGYTPLIAASEYRHTGIVQLLLSLKANVDARNDKGWASLTYAAYNGDEETAVLLLDGGAYVNIQDDDKMTPLDWAVAQGHDYIVELLLSRGAKVGDAIELAKNKDNKKLEDLLASHEEAEDPSIDYDCNYLTSLINNDNKGKIQFLIENELIPVEPEDDTCKDTMIIAARKGNRPIIDSFLTKGIDVNAQADRGEAPLIEAAAEGHKEVVEMLTSSGADLESYGSSALASAAKNGQTEVVEYLLTQTVDINAQGQSGETVGKTPLSEAARAGNKEMIELLLSNGATVDYKNDLGRTPLMTAAIQGKADVVDLLISKGADIHQRDNDGHTAIDLVLRARLQFKTVNYRNVLNKLKKAERESREERKTLKSG